MKINFMRGKTLMDENQILTYEDLAKVLNRSVATLRHDVMCNRIPYIKLGEGKTAQVRFRRTDINAWLAAKLIPAKGRAK
jgi:excisionase family DNA binding protein